MTERCDDKEHSEVPLATVSRVQLDAWHQEALLGNKTAINRLHYWSLCATRSAVAPNVTALAVEFGFKCSEKGMNLETALGAAATMERKEWAPWQAHEKSDTGGVAQRHVEHTRQRDGVAGSIPAAALQSATALIVDADLLSTIRHNESVDENGDPVGARPEEGWETGYAAGIRCLYRFLKSAIADSRSAQK